MRRSLFVGIGANLTSSCHGPPMSTCRWAVDQVVSMTRGQFARISPFYASAPIPVSDQPDFINAVIEVQSSMDPVSFLGLLHEIENDAGRVRGEVNAARVLDLDLLAADDLVLPGPGLILPHPRLAERAFVLCPLSDIAPDWRHPLLGLTAAALRDQLGPQRIERLPPTREDLLLHARALN